MPATINSNGVVMCTPITGYDSVSIKKNDIIVGENSLLNSHDLTKWIKDNNVTTPKVHDDGSCELSVDSNAGSGRLGIYQDITGLKPNTDYTISVYGKFGGLSVCYNDATIGFGTTMHMFSSDGENYTQSFNTGAYGKIRVYLFCQHTHGQITTAQFRCPKIEEGTECTSWCPNTSDVLGDLLALQVNPIEANDFIEF